MYILVVQDGLKDKNPDVSAFTSLAAAKKSATEDWDGSAELTFTILSQDAEGQMKQVTQANQSGLTWVE